MGALVKIFYSWQSDINRKVNKSFIFAALKEAAKNLKTEGGYEIEIDQATRGEPGTPDIPSTILKKIDECTIFIADITLINEKSAERRTPNPNVLIELGYAIKKHGFEKIITIFNNEYGRPEELPFDIKHRKPTQYKYNVDMDKKTIFKSLTTELEKAVLLIDRKTMTKEKIDFIFYDRDEGKQHGKSLTINGYLYKGLTESEFLRYIDFAEMREHENKKKLTEWQEYLLREKNMSMQRRVAIHKASGMPYIVEDSFTDPDETKDYYKKYMLASLARRNKYKFDFLIKNNNEQTMKNIKIVLKTEKKNRIIRKIDIPSLPANSIFSSLVAYRIPQNTEISLFTKKEDGYYILFEYLKENLYPDEEYVLDEPLYISLREEAVIKIGYTIYSENLPRIDGVLEVNMKNIVRELTSIEIFKL